MNATTSCRREADVLRAAREDSWPDALRRHLAECDDCATTAAVAPWMTTFARIGDREHRLPDPSIVWLKARLLQGSAEAARATRPLTIVQIVSYMVVAGGWAAVLTWKWNALQTWLHSLTPTGLISNSANAQSLSLSFFALVIVLASMTVMLALHTIMAEE
jgi:hypothetical protein